MAKVCDMECDRVLLSSVNGSPGSGFVYLNVDVDSLKCVDGTAIVVIFNYGGNVVVPPVSKPIQTVPGTVVQMPRVGVWNGHGVTQVSLMSGFLYRAYATVFDRCDLDRVLGVSGSVSFIAP